MVTIICIIIASVANSVMDTLKFRFERSIFNWKGWMRFCGPESWKNKWRLPPTPSESGRERFLFSSTVMVWTTDMWHLAQKIMIAAFIAAILVYEPVVNWWVDALIMQAVFSGVKELFFGWIWIKPPPAPSKGG